MGGGRECVEETAEQPAPSAAWPDVGLRFDGAFQSPSLEDAFRRWQLADDIVLAGACLVVVVVGGLVYSLVDFRLFGADVQFYALVEVRLLSCLVALLSWRRLRRCGTPAAFDRTVLVLCLLAVAMGLYVGATRPPGRVGHAVVSVLLVSVTYSAVPLPLFWQALLSGLFSTAYVVLMPEHGTTPASAATTSNIAAAFSLANALGVALSWRQQRQRRYAFVTLLREVHLRRQLEQELDSRGLRGQSAASAADL